MVLELAGDRALGGPVTGVVDAGAISLKIGPSAVAKNSTASTPT
jgi:hypothetical protein